MEDLIYAVLMTAAIPGSIVGLLAAIRSGFGIMLLGGLVGLIGGAAGGFGLPGLLNALGAGVPEGPITVVIGSVIGALLLLFLTSGLRRV